MIAPCSWSASTRPAASPGLGFECNGKGRVFYTAAYGHDERVWGHPSFHRLVRNAILWAAPAAVRVQLKLAPDRELAAAIAGFQ